MTDVLSRIHLAGAIFLRAEYTAPWACESPSAAELLRLLRSQARRLVLFDIIGKGVAGFGCRAASTSKPARAMSWCSRMRIDTRWESPQSIRQSQSRHSCPATLGQVAIRHGGGGGRTSVVCGYLHCDAPISVPVVNALPPVFTVRPPSGPAVDWGQPSHRVALEGLVPPSAHAGLALRLPELLFLEVLRLYVQADLPNSAAGLRRCTTQFRAGYNRDAPRTVSGSDTGRAGSPISVLALDAHRAVQPVVASPISTLAEWRLQLAAELLQETTLGVAGGGASGGLRSQKGVFEPSTGDGQATSSVASSAALGPLIPSAG